MRHRYNKLKYLETWVVKKQLVVRNLLTSLIKYWQVKTTPKRAKILKSVADKFFYRARRIFLRYKDDKIVKNELIRLANIYLTNDGWPYRYGGKRKESGQLNVKEKFVDLIAPKLRELDLTGGYVESYKLGFRKWDSTEEILVKLRPELLEKVEVKVK